MFVVMHCLHFITYGLGVVNESDLYQLLKLHLTVEILDMLVDVSDTFFCYILI